MRAIFLILFFCLLFCVSIFSQKARKIDEFGNLYCDYFLPRMDNFIAEVANSPTSKGYVFVYEGKLKRYKHDRHGDLIGTYYISPRFGEAKVNIKSMRRRLISNDDLLKRVKFIEAGFREYFTVEFWFVPEMSQPPKPTPTLKKMRRKGRASGDFCRSLY
jgi:hypothetical protein